MVALICDDQFFVKSTDDGLIFTGANHMMEHRHIKGAPRVFLILEDKWD